MAANKSLTLAQALVDLEAAVKVGDPAVAKTLRKAATAAALAKLAKVAGAIGPDATTWFGWHDGQSSVASIGPCVNDRLLTAAESAAAFAFLAGEGNAPVRESWLPIMENGAGDYVMLDRESGRLLRYHHEDRQRPKLAASLGAWAVEVANAWREVVASRVPKGAPTGWQAVELPNKRALAKKPAGTAYHFRATAKALGPGVFFHLFWKKEKDAWYQATNSTLELCWTSISNNLLPFQASPDAGAAHCLSEENVCRDGDNTLYEQHFEKPPFPTKK